MRGSVGLSRGAGEADHDLRLSSRTRWDEIGAIPNQPFDQLALIGSEGLSRMIEVETLSSKEI